MTKRCSKCGETKAKTAFCRHKRNPDGLHYQCSACKSAYSTSEAGRASQARARAKRKQDPVKYARWLGQIYAWEAANNREIDRDPQKVAARNAAQRAVKRGDIERPAACETCGAEGRTEMHHDSYAVADRLKVRHLCVRCHREHHRRYNDDGTRREVVVAA